MLGFATQAALAAGLPTEPMLRVEAGMHTGRIERIATDAAGRYAVTASWDKTARVWDVASGKLLQVLRPPIAPGLEGLVASVAMSPNGQTVAVGSLTPGCSPACHIHLFDRGSARLLRRLGGLPYAATHLAFSHDGQYLAATLGGSGVRVWRADMSTPMADLDYDGPSLFASWSRGRRLATTSLDGRIRLYRIEGSTLSRSSIVDAPGGKRPMAIAFSPDGYELAVGYEDSPRVDILDGSSLRLRHSADNTGVSSNVGSVAWSADGRQLMAAGAWAVNGWHPVRRWSQAGRADPVDTPVTRNLVISLQPLPGERTLVGAVDPAWGVLDSPGNGPAVWHLRGSAPIADLRLTSSTRDMFRVSSDGRVVQFAFEYDDVVGTMHRFDLAQRRLLAGPDAVLSKPLWQGLVVRDWENQPKPTIDGRALQLWPGELSRSLAIAPDTRSFVLGTIVHLRRFNARGEPLWPQPVAGSGDVWQLNIPPSGKLVVAAYGDGTIRWYRLSDGQELLALFAHADRKRWVLWTPSGYYDASIGGEDLIGWHLNRGADAAADFFPASKFRDRFYRPDVIDQVLGTLDEAQAVAVADAARNRATQPLAALAQALPPVLEVVSPSEVVSSQPQLTIRYKIRSAADAPVTSVFARVNGEALPMTRNLVPVAADGTREIKIDLPPQDSQVQLFAENRHGRSVAATVQVKWAGAAATLAMPATAGTTGFQNRPRLYVLAVGVGKQYQKVGKLNYPAKDAADFAAVMRGQAGALYSEVEVKLLTEQDATRGQIVDALDWLQKKVTQHDVGMLFISGHGDTDNDNNYFFVPVDTDPARLRSTTLPMAEINLTYAKRPGRWLVFIDTCRSGGLLGPRRRAVNDINGAINRIAPGAMVFSSSTTGQYSLEDARWNNGAFTKALVEGLGGLAAERGHKGAPITYKSLDVYVSRRVRDLTDGAQTPVTLNPDGLPDFALAVVK